MTRRFNCPACPAKHGSDHTTIRHGDFAYCDEHAPIRGQALIEHLEADCGIKPTRRQLAERDRHANA